VASGSERLSRTLDRDLKAVTPVALAIEAYAAAVLGKDGAAAVELALVEALTNAIKHGSVNGRAMGQITVTAHADDTALVVEVYDTVPVIPEELLIEAGAHRLEMDYNDIASLAESGRGLSIIVLSMDEVTLRTTKDKYILRMVKYVES